MNEIKKQLNLPPQNVSFIGRENILSDLIGHLDQTGQRIQLIGPDGIGKTTICRQLIYHDQSTLNDIIWLNCDNGILEQLNAYVAPEYGLDPDGSTWIYEMITLLDQRSGPNLLVLDNLTSELVDSGEFRQLLKLNWHIIANATESLNGFEHQYTIDNLTTEQSTALFNHWYQQPIEPNQQASLESLITKAEGCPLSIELMAKMASSHSLDIDHLLDNVAENEFEFIKLLDLAELQPPQQNLLRIIALLPCQPYHLEHEIKQWFSPDTLSALSALCEAGWINHQGDTIIMHGIVADMLGEQLPLNSDALNHFIELFDQAIQPDSHEHWSHKTQYSKPIYHLLAAIDELEANMCEQQQLNPLDLSKANLQHSLGNIYEAHANYDKAIILYQQSLSLFHHVLGKDNENVSMALSDLGGVYTEKGDHKQALKLLKQALEIDQKLHGEEADEIATVLNNIAKVYLDKEDFAEAHHYFQQSLQITEKLHGKQHTCYALTLGNIATVYQYQGEMDKAIELHQQVLDIEEQVLTPNHPDLASSLNNLALAYKAQQQYQKCQPLLARACEIYANSLCTSHPLYKNALHSLVEVNEILKAD